MFYLGLSVIELGLVHKAMAKHGVMANLWQLCTAATGVLVLVLGFSESNSATGYARARYGGRTR